MSELSIKITIAGRTYPLTIRRDEEEQIRRAARNIEEKIREYQESYAVRDKQDLLAMTVLHFATVASSESGEIEQDHHNESLQAIDDMLSNFLKQ